LLEEALSWSGVMRGREKLPEGTHWLFSSLGVLQSRLLETASANAARTQKAQVYARMLHSGSRTELLEPVVNAPTPELIEAHIYLSALVKLGLASLEGLALSRPAPLVERLRAQLSSMAPSEVKQNLTIVLHYIPMLLSSRGMTSEGFQREICAAHQFLKVDGEGCGLRAKQVLSQMSKDIFDDLELRWHLEERTKQYLQEYLGWNAVQRGDDDQAMLSQVLFLGLTTLGSPLALSPSRLERLSADLEASGEGQMHPLPRKQPYSSKQIADEVSKKGGVEMRLEDLPMDWQSLFKRTPMPGHPRLGGLNLWEFLRQNVRSLIVAPWSEQREAATINALTNTVLLPVYEEYQKDVPLLETAGILAHEAYHLYWQRAVGSQSPKLQMARLLNERNAHLLEMLVQVILIRKHLDKAKVVDWGKPGPLYRAIKKNLETRLSLHAANLTLGYPEDDESFHEEIPPTIDPEILSTVHPSELVPGYLKSLGFSDAEEIMPVVLQKFGVEFQKKSKQ
jgi:hypothetical protein